MILKLIGNNNCTPSRKKQLVKDIAKTETNGTTRSVKTQGMVKMCHKGVSHNGNKRHLKAMSCA